MPKQPTGYIIYEGPSELDGAPIVVIATGFAKGSRNSKTGDMLQTWIIRADEAPTDAVHSGADASICGDCPHRGRLVETQTAMGTVTRNIDRTCYVTVFHAPLSVYKGYKRGIYPRVDAGKALVDLFAGRFVRLGSYGDPLAAPLSVWKLATMKAAGWTGYTHQWRTLLAMPDARRLAASLVMASCDSDIDRAEAQLAGWRTFRVMPNVDDKGRGEVLCPASEEAGYKTTCQSCRACGGTSAKARASIAIVAHGQTAKRLLRA